MKKLDPYTRTVEAAVEILAGELGEPRLKVLYLFAVPKEEYGDLAFPAVRYRRAGIDPGALAGRLAEGLRERGIDYVSVEVAGPGYINLRLDAARLLQEVAEAYAEGGEALRVPESPDPMRLVVEHTSANPIHPLHIGHARNMSLGDTLARLLRARGHWVNTRFYIDDVGRQVAVAALGVRLLGIDPLEEARRLGIKPDDLVGWIYAVTTQAIEARLARDERDKAQGAEDRREAEERLFEAGRILARLEDEEPVKGWTVRIVEEVNRLADPEAELSRLMRRYEAGLEPEKSLVRGMVSAVLEGFRVTLERMGVSFDAWDWESDMVWSGRVARILEEARRSPFYTIYKGAEALDLPRFIKTVLEADPELKRAIRIPPGLEVPPLILRRSDGTTLYTTRDMAYTLYKFEVTLADKVYNVIGAEQRLSQLQLRLALAALGHVREAVNLVHYEYEMVNLVGARMSSRRGIIVKLDDILNSLRGLAEEEVRKRNPGASEEWIRETAEKIAVAAVRFRLVQVSAPKPITFDPRRVLDLNANTGPYLQYTYARASGILRKLRERWGFSPGEADPSKCAGGKRRGLLIEALRFPLTAAKAADDMAPEVLATYLIGLADKFNSWYQEDTVVNEQDPGARNCKAVLVTLVREALGKGLGLLGIPAPERM